MPSLRLGIAPSALTITGFSSTTLQLPSAISNCIWFSNSCWIPGLCADLWFSLQVLETSDAMLICSSIIEKPCLMPWRMKTLSVSPSSSDTQTCSPKLGSASVPREKCNGAHLGALGTRTCTHGKIYTPPSHTPGCIVALAYNLASALVVPVCMLCHSPLTNCVAPRVGRGFSMFRMLVLVSWVVVWGFRWSCIR